MITQKSSIVTAWAVVSIFFAVAGACDFVAIVSRQADLAEIAFWMMGVGLVASFILAPVLPPRGALARLVPILFFTAAWLWRRHHIEAPDLIALFLVALGLLAHATVSTAYSSWIRTVWTPSSTLTSSTRGAFTTLISPLRSK